MAYEFVDDLPAGVIKPKAHSVFTPDLVDALKSNPGRWAKVEEATAQGAAAWIRNIGDGFEYRSVDTGKPEGKPRKSPKGNGTYQPTKKDVYVRYQPLT